MPLSFLSAGVATMQAFNQGLQRGATQLFAVGPKLYYVTRAQIGSAPSLALQVYESSNIVGWSLVATYPGLAGFTTDTNPSNAPSCLVGTIIYTIGIATSLVTPSQTSLVIHRFDTAANAFLADSAIGPLQTGPGQLINQLQSISGFNNGTLLVTSTNPLGATPTTAAFQIQIYTPSTDTWGPATTVLSDSSQVVQQVHDPVSDLAFVFYRKAATGEVRCLTVSSTLTFNDTTVFNLGAHNPAGSFFVGLPVISNGEIVIPYIVPATHFLNVARAPVGVNPTFSLDLVENLTTLPAGSTLSPYDQVNGPGWMGLNISGTLYMFYTIDNGELDNASSQSFLYFRSSTGPGVWSAPTLAYSSSVPNEMFTPFGAPVPASNPVILLGLANPVTFPAIASFSNVVLFLGPAAAPAAPPMLGGGASGRFRCCGPGDGFRMRQLEALRQYIKTRQDSWPYVHEYPDRFSIPVETPITRVAAPLPAVLTVLASYQVPEGFRFYLEGLVFDVETGGFSPGDALWTLFCNSSTAHNTQGQPIQGFVSVPVPLGLYEVGRWWVLPRVYEFAADAVVQATVINVNVPAGAPNFFTTGFLGYLEPVA